MLSMFVSSFIHIQFNFALKLLVVHIRTVGEKVQHFVNIIENLSKEVLKLQHF